MTCAYCGHTVAQPLQRGAWHVHHKCHEKRIKEGGFYLLANGGMGRRGEKRLDPEDATYVILANLAYRKEQEEGAP